MAAASTTTISENTAHTHGSTSCTSNPYLAGVKEQGRGEKGRRGEGERERGEGRGERGEGRGERSGRGEGENGKTRGTRKPRESRESRESRVSRKGYKM